MSIMVFALVAPGPDFVSTHERLTPLRPHRVALRPSGTVKIEGQKYSVVTGGEMIQQDEAVIVVKVEGNRIVVRRRAPGEPANFPGS